MTHITKRPWRPFAIVGFVTVVFGWSTVQAQEPPGTQKSEGKPGQIQSEQKPSEGQVEERGVPGMPGISPIIRNPVESQAQVSSTIQKCAGPDTLIQPNGSFPLTCPVNSTLAGYKMLVLPEMWLPGNGCIVTVEKPRVVMIGNNFGVAATFTNRCGSAYKASEGGLAWMILQIQ
jgi:hypothetical protein